MFGEGDHIVLFTLFNRKGCFNISFVIKMMLNFSLKYLNHQYIQVIIKLLRVIFLSLRIESQKFLFTSTRYEDVNCRCVVTYFVVSHMYRRGMLNVKFYR